MLFNSWTFLVFLGLTFLCYYGGPRGLPQILLLTLASYVFYAWHAPWLVLVLSFCTLLNAGVVLRLFAQPGESAWAPATILRMGIVGNLLVLAIFKYAALLAGTLLPKAWLELLGWDLQSIPLPVGISFFTFQGISLIVDVYQKTKGREELAWSHGEALTQPGPQRRLPAVLDIAFFKAFFPQLVAGPIVKAHQFMNQIGPKRFQSIAWEDAIKKLILGYFLKMVVADNLREVAAGLAYPAYLQMSGLNLLFLLYAFSFQIFADFCGYSLIAMGLAGLFGYRLPPNFHFPYLSASVTEFWRRWHISLSSWLKEYLYIPLGGNRRGQLRTYLNLIVVMLLGGLWHGAAWKFMFWGGAHGLCLATERFFSPRLTFLRQSGAWVRIFQVAATFHLVSALWLLFQIGDLSQGWLFLQRLVQWPSGISPQPVFGTIIFGGGVVLYHGYGGWRENRGRRLSAWIESLFYAGMLFLLLTNSGVSSSFIYFQF